MNHQFTLLSLLSLAFILLLTFITPPPITSVTAYNVHVAAKDEECFMENVLKGEKVVGSFQVTDGGQLDIDFRILGPDSKVIYEKERSVDTSYQFKALQEGLHTICFDNRMSTMSGKAVKWHFYVGDRLHQKDAASAKNLSPLESAIIKTAEGMSAIKDNIGYIKVREERHALTVDSTNGRVVFWSSINVFAVLAMAAVQVWTIRGMFEKTRKA